MSRLSRIKDSLGRMEVTNKRSCDNAIQETIAYTYNASSGNVRILYDPLSAEVKIMDPNTRQQFGSWRDESPSISLSPQDAFEISIYLLGLQPHIRDVLARKDNALSQDTPSIEYPTPDMVEQDL